MICFQLGIDIKWLKYAKINKLLKIIPLVSKTAILKEKPKTVQRKQSESSNRWSQAGDYLAYLWGIGVCKETAFHKV